MFPFLIYCITTTTSKQGFQSPAKYVPSPPTKPNDPKMGTCIETYKGSNSFHCVFGGAPKPDRSGIQDLSKRSISDLHLISLDPVTGQKSTHYRQ